MHNNLDEIVLVLLELGHLLVKDVHELFGHVDGLHLLEAGPVVEKSGVSRSPIRTKSERKIRLVR